MATLAKASTAVRAAAVTVILSFVLLAHERTLTPLYGSGPTTHLLDKIVLTAALLSPLCTRPLFSVTKAFLVTLALTGAPNGSYWIGVWTSRRKDPVLGPAATHAAVLGPLVILLTSSMYATKPSSAPSPNKYQIILLQIFPSTLVSGLALLLNRRILGPSPYLYAISDSQIYLTLAFIFYCIALYNFSFTKSQPPKASSKKSSKSKETTSSPSSFEDPFKAILFLSFSVAWLLYSPLLASPVLPHPLLTPYIHPSYPLQILFAEQSVTGLITVGQWLPPAADSPENPTELHSARYIRASHSLLGGVWTHDKVQILDDDPPLMDNWGNALGDSIYSTFVLQEAVRLINSTEAGKAKTWNNALVIGLGVGISATSFMRHEIPTTIVEIDPAVYKAARGFFGLPDPGKGRVFLEDARGWVSNQRAAIEAGITSAARFDIVVHDCFSGGGVPEHIFTMEFWQDMTKVLEPEGVLVVNFAGVLMSESSKLVINTLEKSFSQCRAFHDLFGDLPQERYATEFINIVIFCTNSPAPLTFRDSRKSDWLGSPLRRHVLQSLDTREVNLDWIRDVRADDRYILTDANNTLGALQSAQGAHHWSVMREVLPNEHWETY